MLDIEMQINQTQAYINEKKEVDGDKIAHRYSICATSSIAYKVWERSTGNLLPMTHSTITFDETYGRLGDMTTRKITDDIEALPLRTRERTNAVQKYYSKLKQEAEQIIRTTFPEDFKEVSKSTSIQ